MQHTARHICSLENHKNLHENKNAIRSKCNRWFNLNVRSSLLDRKQKDITDVVCNLSDLILSIIQAKVESINN